MRSLLPCVLTMLLVVPHVSVPQSAEYQLAQLVATRKPLMFGLQDAYWVLLAVNNGENDDYAAAAGAARSMAEAMDSFLALMEPGTARGEAPGSRAKPEVWTEAEAFAATAGVFRQEALAFAETADSGDPAAYADAFETLTAACTGCHGFRPSSGGPFRFAKGE